MGLTAIALIHSGWGKRSGAHMNPAVTLTFLRLGKIRPWDALFFVTAQIFGGIAGVLLVVAVFGHAFTDPPVSYAATQPGPAGAGRGVSGRSGHLRISHAGPALAFFLETICPLYRICRRVPRGHLHLLRVTALGHEYESGAQLRVSGSGHAVAALLDLHHGPRARHAHRRPVLSHVNGRASGAVRQVVTSARRAMHPLRI